MEHMEDFLILHPKLSNNKPVIESSFFLSRSKRTNPAVNTLQPISKRAKRGIESFLEVLSNALAIVLMFMTSWEGLGMRRALKALS